MAVTTSAAEEDARLAKGAKVVKAFHTTFASLMASESRMFGDHVILQDFTVVMMLHAKAVVSNLIQDTGLEPLDVGPLANARCLEPLAFLMMNLGIHSKDGDEHRSAPSEAMILRRIWNWNI